MTGYNTPSGSHKILNVDCRHLFGKKSKSRPFSRTSGWQKVSGGQRRYKKSITGKFGLKTIVLKTMTVQTKMLKKPLLQDNGIGYVKSSIGLDFRFADFPRT